MKKFPIFALALVAVMSPLTSGAVTFACTPNSPLAEVLICADVNLSAKDDEMATIYKELRKRKMYVPSKEELKTEQLKWLSYRNSCRNTICLNSAYQTRIRELNEYKNGIYEVSVYPPQCSSTVISNIGSRLEGASPKEVGISIIYRNGLSGVSYDYVPAISERSRINDPVKVCWVSMYANCPPGDNRGNTYQTTNLRTGEKWELPDAMHVCGGA
jgi:uncharacterized protein YecT (DUF1311 family)